MSEIHTYTYAPHYTINKVCLEPFPDKSVKTETIGEGQFKVAKVTNTKTNLVKLKVLKNCRWYLAGGQLQQVMAGSYVWLRASDYAAPWGKDVLTAGDEQYILVPCDRIEVIEGT